MKKILIALSLILIFVQIKGENKYFPSGTTWTEITKWWSDCDTTIYEVKDEVLMDGIVYNEVLANGKRYCLLREEGPLVYIWLSEYENGLLYDFDWWEGKKYAACEFGDYSFIDVITKIEDKVLADGQTYQIWAPERMFGDYIICGVGGTNSILKYYEEPVTGGGGTFLLEFTRGDQLFNKENGTDGINKVGIGESQERRPIRLMKNPTGGFDLQIRNAEGIWQIVK